MWCGDDTDSDSEDPRESLIINRNTKSSPLKYKYVKEVPNGFSTALEMSSSLPTEIKKIKRPMKPWGRKRVRTTTEVCSEDDYSDILAILSSDSNSEKSRPAAVATVTLRPKKCTPLAPSVRSVPSKVITPPSVVPLVDNPPTITAKDKSATKTIPKKAKEPKPSVKKTAKKAAKKPPAKKSCSSSSKVDLKSVVFKEITPTSHLRSYAAAISSLGKVVNQLPSLSLEQLKSVHRFSSHTVSDINKYQKVAVYTEMLHVFNDTKDIAERLIGIMAELKGEALSTLHERYMKEFDIGGKKGSKK